jgi:hypothetical protein
LFPAKEMSLILTVQLHTRIKILIRNVGQIKYASFPSTEKLNNFTMGFIDTTNPSMIFVICHTNHYWRIMQ